MEQRLSVVTLGVRDLARSRAFYDALGWRAADMKAPGVAFYQLGGIILSLYGRADLAADAGLADSEPGFSGMTLSYNCRDRAEVDAVMALAARSGARVLKSARDAFWGGYHGHFADPDGHLWEAAWNPAFPIAADGSIKLPS